MKIKNIGNSNFILKDKRGNSIILEPSFTADVEDSKGKKLVKIYPANLKEVVEVEVKTKVEVEVQANEENKIEVNNVEVKEVKEVKKKKGKK